MCEHFEGVLKVMGMLKSLVMKVPELASQSRNVGMFPARGHFAQTPLVVMVSCELLWLLW